MNLVLRRFGAPLPSRRIHTSASSSQIRASLPFTHDKAKFHRELDAAINVVERACRLCVDVKKSLLSSEGRILEKKDQTPVTVADFGVQALISLELNMLFPLVPLVAEEDSMFLRSCSEDSQNGNSVVDLVVKAVTQKASVGKKSLSSDDVLEAIDRGGKDAFEFGSLPATYWVLDPIDGTRGFLKGDDALYVVGLALVVDGEIVLGVMGCPNWKEDVLSTKDDDNVASVSETGIIMISHIGCGTWTKRLLGHNLDSSIRIQDVWERCVVDNYFAVHDAKFCIPDSQTWESMPLPESFSSKTDTERSISLIPACCGSLCKYMMVASGRASVFIQRAKPQILIKVWDHAVGVLCVHEAGGQVTDWRGKPLDLAEDQLERRIIYPSGGVLVSNGNLHGKLLHMITSNSSAV